jgi:hypothetical protein
MGERELFERQWKRLMSAIPENLRAYYENMEDSEKELLIPRLRQYVESARKKGKRSS